MNWKVFGISVLGSLLAASAIDDFYQEVWVRGTISIIGSVALALVAGGSAPPPSGGAL